MNDRIMVTVSRPLYPYDVSSALPAFRVVTIDSSGDLKLAGASDERVGFTHSNTELRDGRQDVLPRCHPEAVTLAVGAGDPVLRGGPAYQAADGKIAGSGTKLVGTSLDNGNNGTVVKVVPG